MQKQHKNSPVIGECLMMCKVFSYFIFGSYMSQCSNSKQMAQSD